MSELQEGDRIEIRHKRPMQRFPRRTVCTFLERDGGDYVVSLRPKFGTSRFPDTDILRVTVVPKDTPLVVDERL